MPIAIDEKAKTVTLDTAFVRAQFPPLKDGWVFVENAGGSYVPQQVIARLSAYMSSSQVQPNWDFESSQRATSRIKTGKQRMAEFINADEDEIVLGPSTTMNIYVMSQALRPWFKPGDEIIVSEQDHEANIGAWRKLEEFGVVVREWPVDRRTGALQKEALERLLNEKTRLVAFTHCSNVCSIVHDAAAIVRKIHAAGALAFIDGTAYAPHFPIDVKAIDADFYAFSLYKVCGPHQSVLYGKRALLAKAHNQNHFFIPAENTGYRLMPGGPNHELAAATVGITDYFDALYHHHFDTPENSFHKRLAAVYRLIGAHENRLAQRITDFLSDKPGIHIIGRDTGNALADGRLAPVIGFWVNGRRSQDIAAGLHRHRIAIGHGDFWAHRVVKALGLDAEDGVVRIGLAHYNDDQDIDRLIAALQSVLEL